jgi:hypothetical protein
MSSLVQRNRIICDWFLTGKECPYISKGTRWGNGKQKNDSRTDDEVDVRVKKFKREFFM